MAIWGRISAAAFPRRQPRSSFTASTARFRSGAAMKLYGYFRSSAAFRVRIALNLKRLDYESAFIHLRRGDQAKPEFLGVNPQGLVPMLEVDEQRLTQSLAIIEY